MAFTESLSVALFTISVVIGVLAVLFFLIKLFSYVLGYFEKSLSKNISANETVIEEETNKIEDNEIEEDIFSSGTLKLINVDEPTAAMIMAIVSDESGIPLSQLCFKSIRLINKQ